MLSVVMLNVVMLGVVALKKVLQYLFKIIISLLFCQRTYSPSPPSPTQLKHWAPTLIKLFIIRCQTFLLKHASNDGTVAERLPHQLMVKGLSPGAGECKNAKTFFL
jgi:hypothetical protein